MMPECNHAQHVAMDMHPMMMMNTMSAAKMPVDMVEEWQPSMMNMKPAMEMEDTMAMMKMMAKMKNGAKMAHNMADQKMQMHMNMHAENGKPAAMPNTMEASPKPPCKANPMTMTTMTAIPNGAPMMPRPQMMARPEVMSEPLMAMPPQMMQPMQPMMQQPMMMPMMRNQNNAFPSNVMAGGPMDRRA